ncbi:hypothetical protein ACF068_14725 [Streptomyces sp. NPDC016309]|uniref:hypothetical protein n=1 Tax=Streptomyces sp. NPDC016309 TaxID=3364965 RepID=UPI0036F98B17
MSTDRTPVDGPFRIHVDATPGGARLDVSHYLATVILGIASAAEEDPEGLLGELTDLAGLARQAAHQGPDSHAAHERDARVEELLAEVAGEGHLPVYEEQVNRLAHALLLTVRPRPVPHQREAGAA